MSTRFFSTDEIRRLRSWPEEIGRNELISYFTLGSDDRVWLQRSARGAGNRLGLAVQLCALPWLGFVPDDVPAVPRSASNRLAVQLGLPVAELDSYGEREQTRTGHLRLAAARLGVRVVAVQDLALSIVAAGDRGVGTLEERLGRFLRCVPATYVTRGDLRYRRILYVYYSDPARAGGAAPSPINSSCNGVMCHAA